MPRKEKRPNRGEILQYAFTRELEIVIGHCAKSNLRRVLVAETGLIGYAEVLYEARTW